ncbi:MAG: glucoamylase family protein [Nitrosospira sp.]
MFIHQLSHAWIDFRGIQDWFMRGQGGDHSENARRVMLIQQRYARELQKHESESVPERWLHCDIQPNFSG